MSSPTETRTTPPAVGPLIAADQVVKAFAVGSRSVEILHGVTLRVFPGEMVAVMGPSGSGKSTLLYCLAGLEEPTGGSVALAGTPLKSLNRAARAKMRRREVGFVFQQYNLIPTLSAYENVALPYRLRRDTPPRDAIVKTLESVNLGSLVNAMPPSMSGGEQQRVALARVLAQKPKVVFADEPTGALDTGTGRQVLAELAVIAHQPDQCVLTVTHDPTVAAACDRVLFMRDGTLVRELAKPTADQVAATLASLTKAESGAA